MRECEPEHCSYRTAFVILLVLVLLVGGGATLVSISVYFPAPPRFPSNITFHNCSLITKLDFQCGTNGSSLLSLRVQARTEDPSIPWPQPFLAIAQCESDSPCRGSCERGDLTFLPGPGYLCWQNPFEIWDTSYRLASIKQYTPERKGLQTAGSILISLGLLFLAINFFVYLRICRPSQYTEINDDEVRNTLGFRFSGKMGPVD